MVDQHIGDPKSNFGQTPVCRLVCEKVIVSRTAWCCSPTEPLSLRTRCTPAEICSPRRSHRSYIQLLTDFPMLMHRLNHLQWLFLLSPHFSCSRWEGIMTLLLFVQITLKVAVCLEHNYLLGVWLSKPFWYEWNKQMHVLNSFSICRFGSRQSWSWYRKYCLQEFTGSGIKWDISMERSKGNSILMKTFDVRFKIKVDGSHTWGIFFKLSIGTGKSRQVRMNTHQWALFLSTGSCWHLIPKLITEFHLQCHSYYFNCH